MRLTNPVPSRAAASGKASKILRRLASKARPKKSRPAARHPIGPRPLAAARDASSQHDAGHMNPVSFMQRDSVQAVSLGEWVHLRPPIGRAHAARVRNALSSVFSEGANMQYSLNARDVERSARAEARADVGPSRRHTSAAAGAPTATPSRGTMA